jgi:hypothetical protein
MNVRSYFLRLARQALTFALVGSSVSRDSFLSARPAVVGEQHLLFANNANVNGYLLPPRVWVPLVWLSNLDGLCVWVSTLGDSCPRLCVCLSNLAGLPAHLVAGQAAGSASH